MDNYPHFCQPNPPGSDGGSLLLADPAGLLGAQLRLLQHRCDREFFEDLEADGFADATRENAMAPVPNWSIWILDDVWIYIYI